MSLAAPVLARCAMRHFFASDVFEHCNVILSYVLLASMTYVMSIAICLISRAVPVLGAVHAVPGGGEASKRPRLTRLLDNVEKSGKRR